jgi:hypothetical protein
VEGVVALERLPAEKLRELSAMQIVPEQFVAGRRVRADEPEVEVVDPFRNILCREVNAEALLANEAFG